MTLDEMWKRSPPYVSYKTFESLMGRLRMHLPTHIDMSYLSGKFSISDGIELMHAMRFLNLIDANARPMPRLKLLVSTTTDEHRAALLRQVADEAYAFVFRGTLDTQNATYIELEDVFLHTYRMDRDVCRRCINFFIDFCKDAGILLSSQITQKRIQNTTLNWIEDKRIKSECGDHRSDNQLQQVKFLHTLAKDFNHHNQMYVRARQTLKHYDKIPKSMTKEEWRSVWISLSQHYQYVRFLYKIALLTESGIIDPDLLYIFYYPEIVENSTFILNTLIKWCGTGLELAANYQSFDISHIAITLVNLINKLDAIYQNHRNDVPFSIEVTENFVNRTRDFLSNPAQFSMDTDKIVTIQ